MENIALNAIIAAFTGIGALGSVGTWFRLGKLETKVEMHDKDIREIKREKKTWHG